ncbi:hypothetical protein FT663_01908 [Candidozyma haemuli var. vulneris]|uniref:Increased recombination centers protein 6 n=1 Tax=Candidozyma haemuli TaxID=45357 RepID=A0A2V1AVA0_9ASCO|nr:hypothetical protein CXQ85_000436 [[Candida] haemuloni]KAF3989760.1 hypothetical protein FT662_02635 [[Candida] haemuloni var. vulneris]KAF3993318.1 hypothetical protein FT663_01908 [[Candida] haemuloni var. vulneris]PVH21456.1 hypothetical protein CXQ85_000436 [[Candida] haemuloni]
MIPNNVLVLGPPKTGKVRLAQHITKDLDTSTIPDNSHSGLIYNCDLKTKYFSTQLNLLLEEFPEERPHKSEECLESLTEWNEAFKSDEYQELREALDGIIFTIDPECVSTDEWAELLNIYSQVRDGLDTSCFAVVMAAKAEKKDEVKLEQFEDECIQYGIEFVYEGESGINEFKEKLGKDRVLEILETHEWSNISSSEPEEYVKHKESKIDDMTRGLLESEGDESMPLDQLMDKLRLERSKVEGMAPEEKESYVKQVMEELIDYI